MSCVTGLPLQPWTLSSWSGTCYHAIRHPRGIRIERARKGFEENLWETFGLWSVTKNLPRCLNVNPLRFRALWILQAVRSWGLLTFASQFYGTLNFFLTPHPPLSWNWKQLNSSVQRQDSNLSTSGGWDAQALQDEFPTKTHGLRRPVRYLAPRITIVLQNETPKELKIIWNHQLFTPKDIKTPEPGCWCTKKALLSPSMVSQVHRPSDGLQPLPLSFKQIQTSWSNMFCPDLRIT